MPKADPPSAIILTAGDVSVEWLWFDLTPEDQQKRQKEYIERTTKGGAAQPPFLKWLRRPQVESVAVHGGAWYTDTFIRMMIGWEHRSLAYGYARYESDELRSLTIADYVHGDTGYKAKEAVPVKDEKVDSTRVYRVSEGPTYSGPTDPLKHKPKKHPQMRPVDWDTLGWNSRQQKFKNEPPLKRSQDSIAKFPTGIPSVLVLHDEANGFAQQDRHWKDFFTSPTSESDIRIVIWNLVAPENLIGLLDDTGRKELKTDPSLSRNPLWNYLADSVFLDRLVVLVTADDLRSAGVRINRSLSWERTSFDIRSQMKTHPILKQLARARHVVIRFGVSGALHYSRQSDRFALFYDTENVEGEFRRSKVHGDMLGYNSTMAATLACAFREGFEAASKSTPNQAACDLIVRATLDGPLDHAEETELKKLFNGKPPAIVSGQAIRMSVANCRAYFRNGFGIDARDLHQRLERWDQIANSRGPHIYPPQLTSFSVYEYRLEGEDAGSVLTFKLACSEQVPLKSHFHGPSHELRDGSLRPRGANLIHPAFVVKDLARQTQMYLEQEAEKCRPTEWIVRSVESKASDIALAEIVLKKSRGKYMWAELGVAFENLLQTLTGSKKARKETDPRLIACSTAEDLAAVCHKRASRTIDWHFGWPVCVRGFKEDEDRIARAEVGTTADWAILDSSPATLLEIAKKIVKEGASRALSKASPSSNGGDGRFPVVQFGDLRTADRQEGESYRSIRNIIREYLDREKVERPLSLAVFGPPGSGKSFGVKQIASHIGKDRCVIDENNLSQFTSREDLVQAFIRVRDKASGGKVPLVFFDEFDSALDRQTLAWLKYFLSVMQDGKYRYRDGDLNVGKAILVFAGGTSNTFRDFTRDSANQQRQEEFRDAKGPDFVSRLRGHVDIIGPNPRDPDRDRGYVVRRALALSHLIRQHHPRLLDQEKRVRIDDQVLRALLEVPIYKHGSRSIEAVIETSSLRDVTHFDKSALLPEDQLAMHLDWADNNWADFLEGRGT